MFKITRKLIKKLIKKYFHYCWIQTNKSVWVWSTIVSDNKFAFSNCDKYCPMDRGNLLGHMSSFLFIHHKFGKNKFSRQHFKKICQTLKLWILVCLLYLVSFWKMILHQIQEIQYYLCKYLPKGKYCHSCERERMSHLKK